MKRSRVWTIVLAVVGFIGLCLLLYPTVSDFYNRNYTTHAVAEYTEMVDNTDKEMTKKCWADAKAYNNKLLSRSNPFELPPSLVDEYNSSFGILDKGLIGYIEISKINVSLPVYHGTGDETLSKGVGHLNWSSLPTGGESTHCVVSGHRGLVNAKLFTDLDMLREGDVFVFHVLDQTLTYEVDQIRTVLPDEVSDLAIVEGKDYCTLVTCTPYGINTHRLLVRGHRVKNELKDTVVISEAVVIDQIIVAVCLAVPLLLILVCGVIFKKPKKKKKLTVDDYPLEDTL